MKMDPSKQDSSDDSADNVPLKDLIRIKVECMEFEAEEEQFTIPNITSSVMNNETHEPTTATPTSEIESYNQDTMRMHTDGENVFFLKPESLALNFDVEKAISTTIVKKVQPEIQLKPKRRSISRKETNHQLRENYIDVEPGSKRRSIETCTASDSQCDTETGQTIITMDEVSEDTYCLTKDSEDTAAAQQRSYCFTKNKIKTNLDEALQEWLIGSLENHQILNSACFKEFIVKMAPSYRHPTMEKMPQNFFIAYRRNLNSLKSFVNLEARSVCISVETWTTWQSEVYQSVMAHFLATSTMELKSVLLDVCWLGTDNFNVNDASFAPREIVDTWNLHGKVNLVVYDGSEVIADAYKMCMKNPLMMKCYAKTLSDIVKKAMAPFEIITKKLRFLAIVWQSVSRDENIEEDLSGFDASIESPTWLYMLYVVVYRFHDVCRHVKTYQDKENIIYQHILTQDELELCKEFYQFMEPFEEIVRFITSKTYLTAAVPIPMTCVLLKVLARMQGETMHSLTGLSVLNQLIKGVKDLVPILEGNYVLRVCTFLDPRFKGLFFSKAHVSESVKISVQQQIISKCEKEKHSKRKAETNSVWNTFEFIAKEMNAEMTACREIEKYLACDTAPRMSSPLLWWNDNKKMLPNLLKIFYDNYGAVASCAPCQNFFTAKGKRFNVQRSQLHKDYVREVLFLNVNKSINK